MSTVISSRLLGDRRITKAPWTGFSTKPPRISSISVLWTKPRDYWSTRIYRRDLLFTPRDWPQVGYFSSLSVSSLTNISVGAKIAAKHRKSEDTSGIQRSTNIKWFYITATGADYYFKILIFVQIFKTSRLPPPLTWPWYRIFPKE